MRPPLNLSIYTLLLFVNFPFDQAQAEDIDLTEFSITELMQAEVTTVSRSEQRFADTAAAVFVINQKDIEHSGVTNIPDLLRMVPGVNVARISASKWAVSARGVNSRFANKLQVLIDGRSIYTPTFSGTYWESNDMVLEDIERIEVVRGPGSSVWGANAVNGVINIITKNSTTTQRALAAVNAGNEEQTVSLRYGGQFSELGNYRTYFKYLHRDGQLDALGNNANDEWSQYRGGLRMDWQDQGDNEIMLNADIYSADIRQSYTDTGSISDPGVKVFNSWGEAHGGSIQASWAHNFSLASKITSQIYYQNFYRKDELQDERRHTLDLDFRHEWAALDKHQIIWGMGYRMSRDSARTSYFISGDLTQKTLHLYNAFFQDRILFFENKVELTLGTRVQYHTLDDWQWLPTAKVLWKLHPKHRLWASISRSTRTPSRAETAADYRPIQLFPDYPIDVQVSKGPVTAEKIMSYEAGYRTWPMENLSLDVAFFFNQYRDNIILQLDDFNFFNRTLTLAWDNASNVDAYGAELAGDWRPSDYLKFNLAYSYLTERYWFDNVSINLPGIDIAPNNVQDPEHHVSLRGTLSLPHDISVDLWYRYVSEIEQINTALPDSARSISDYHAVDFRLAWKPTQAFTLALVGKNLNQSGTLQYMEPTATFPTEIQRSIYAQLVFKH